MATHEQSHAQRGFYRVVVDYPNEFSKLLFSQRSLPGKKVLDIGCGNHPELGEWVMSQGAKYFFCDINHGLVNQMVNYFRSKRYRDFGYKAADVTRNLGMPAGYADVVHSRFLLSGIQPERRCLAVKEMLAVASERALFLEFDQATWQSTRHSELFGRFTTLYERVQSEFGFCAISGTEWTQMVRSLAGGASCKSFDFIWPEDDNTDYLVAVCRGNAMALARTPRLASLAEQFGLLAEEFSKNPIEFAPPIIRAVVVTK